MSQHDMDIANSGGASVRADINAALLALASNSSGATAPSATFAYQFWADTTSGWLKQRNAANSAWIVRMPLGSGAAADIASAATVDLTAATGDIVRITGTTATTGWTINAGQRIVCVAVGAWPLTYHATNNPVQGSASYTCAAGDIVIVSKDGNGDLHVEILRRNGMPMSMSGQVIQHVEAVPFTTYASDSAGSLPMDDTIPQKTEGANYVSLSITPKFATSRLVIRGEALVGGNGANNVGAFIADTAINDALAANVVTLSAAGHMDVIPVYAEISAGSTSARTYQLRLGAASGVTFFVNGNTSNRFFGGVAGCKLSCEEVSA